MKTKENKESQTELRESKERIPYIFWNDTGEDYNYEKHAESD